MKRAAVISLVFIFFGLLLMGPGESIAKKEKLKIQELKKASAPVETKTGVLFTYTEKKVESVSVSGTFNKWEMNKNQMKKNEKELWFTIIPLPKGKIEYKYVLNSKDWVHDPMNKKKIEDSYGGGFKSVLEVKQGVSMGGAIVSGNKVLFRYHDPAANTASVAGSFNDWNVNANKMSKDDNGFWTVELELIPGTYQYKYVVDGNDWKKDPMNPDSKEDGFGGENSILEIK
ncbi:MAG: glycogen-binding domain-containing protein [Spirochaetes bacterium]|nr:glycogen-binding domain-containing protein [Spirochaetota bacterium]